MKRSYKTAGAIALLLLVAALSWPAVSSAWSSLQTPGLPSKVDQSFDKSSSPFQPSQVQLHDSPLDGEANPALLRPGDVAPGLYAAREYRNLSPSEYPIIGGHRSFYWNQLEPNEGQYNWSWIYSFINSQVQDGKQAAFGISTYNGLFGGISVPSWFINAYPYAIVTCGSEGDQIPKYWHSRYLEKYGNFVSALGQEFDGNPYVSWIQIGTGLYGENQPCAEYYDNCLKTAGLDMGTWIATSNAITDYYLNAFSETPVLFQFAPIYINSYERKACSAYAADRGAGLMHDGLVPDRESAYGSNSTCDNEAGHWDPIIKYNSSVPISFETYLQYLETHTDVYWALLNGLSKHADYINVGKCLLNHCDQDENLLEPLQPRTDNFPIFRFANKYLGKTIENTPSVWVALRDSEFAFCPDVGNFEFWLYQDDDVANGHTVPEWNVSAAKQGRYTRRTDQATNNSFMYFDVDDSYIYGGTNEVQVSVTYYDQGLDSWELQYQGPTAGDTYKSAGVVSKGNSGTWITATFNIDDAQFSNMQAGGNDFRIDCLGDGNEYIHKVDVQKLGANQISSQLNIGWNLVSLPLIPPDTDLPTVLSSIDGLYEKVSVWNNGSWRDFIVGKPLPAQNLTALDVQMGIWIKMNAPGTLTLTGTPPSSTSIALTSGYNSIGYPATSARSVSDALSSIAGKYDKVLRYVGGQYEVYRPDVPPIANDFDQLEPGYGYWIRTTEPTTLVVSN